MWGPRQPTTHSMSATQAAAAHSRKRSKSPDPMRSTSPKALCRSLTPKCMPSPKQPSTPPRATPKGAATDIPTARRRSKSPESWSKMAPVRPQGWQKKAAQGRSSSIDFTTARISERRTTLHTAALRILESIELGKGWSAVKTSCRTGAVFSSESFPLASMRTVEEYAEWMATLAGKTCRDYSFTINSITASSSEVTVTGTCSGSHTGPGGPVPATKGKMTSAYAFVLTFDQSGKLQHLHKVWDAFAAYSGWRWPFPKHESFFAPLAAAQGIFESIESGEGWHTLELSCSLGAVFSCDAFPLRSITTVKEYAEWRADMVKHISKDLECEIKTTSVTGNEVTISASATGTHTGRGGPVPPTKRRMTTMYTYTFSFDAAGRLSRLTKVWDVYAMYMGWGWPFPELPSMQPREGRSHKELALTIFAMIDSGKGYRAIESLCATGAVFQSDAFPLLDIRTVQAYANWMVGVATKICPSDFCYTIHSVTGERDVVTISAECSGTYTGEGGPVPATNRTMSCTYSYTFTFGDGHKLVHMSKVWDAFSAYTGWGWPLPVTEGYSRPYSPKKDRLYATEPSDVLARVPFSTASNFNPLPRTINEAFESRVLRYRDHTALRHLNEDGSWTEFSMGDFDRAVQRVAQSLVAGGLEKHDSISIVAGATSWSYFAAMGAVRAGGVVAPINPDLEAGTMKVALHHAGSKFIFVEDVSQLSKVVQRRTSLPSLKYIVLMHGTIKPEETTSRILMWDEFLFMGDEVRFEGVVAARVESLVPGNTCCILFTDGTTGQPKPTLHSHDGLMYNAAVAYQMWTGNSFGEEEEEVACLPLSHCGGLLQFAARSALDEGRFSVVTFIPRFPHDKLKSFPPTMVVAPAVGWVEATKLTGGFTSNGLSRVKAAVCPCEPLPPDTFNYLQDRGITVQESYGSAETGGVSLSHSSSTAAVDSVGKPVVLDSARTEGEDKEVLIRHRGIMMGYLFNEQASAEAIDKHAWVHTGDMVSHGHDVNGLHTFIGRVEDVIVTASGQRIPPSPIEKALKRRVPAAQEVVVVGGYQRYLGVLFTIRTVPFASGPLKGLPSDDLTEEAILVDPTCKVLEDVVRSETWKQYLASEMHQYNASAVHPVRKWTILPKIFLPVGSDPELTASGKLRRKVVEEKYAKTVRSLYDQDYILPPGVVLTPR
eukprot:Sspe_Gene.71655::Locus_42561_Transcript_1_1_Confidence_1.000_Length_3641::g.71655::m.71655/K15013/ACSBG; long-chain-fatty-acid--CoA ligase ACSBG